MACLLYSVALDSPAAVATARSRVRELARRLELEPSAQTRLAAAVTEVAGNAQVHGLDGRLDLLVEPGTPPLLAVQVIDRGPGIADLDAVLEGRNGAAGLALVRRMIEGFEAASGPGGTTIRLVRSVPEDAARLDLPALAAHLAAMPDTDWTTEAAVQARALLSGLVEADRLNAELEDTNRGVVALYAELDERAEQLRQASELKSRFLSHMSHEFRTPLNSVLALAHLLLDETDGPLTDEQMKQVGYIRRSAESLSELVNDLLDLAKVEAGKLDLRPKAFTVQELFGALRGVMKPLQQSDAVDLVFDDPADCPALFTDEPKVAQVLRNLISNALKFTERGEVRVSAGFDRSAGHCIFTVRDTGIGIAPENHALVFQEFGQVASPLQGRAKGTGLGLPLSRRLAELLGGNLGLQSTPGSGSVFTLALPVVLPLAEPAAPDLPALPPETGGVLVIDDEEMSRYVLRQMLAGLPDLRVMEAETGALGLRRAIQERPDVILLDLRMPGMDGFEVLDRLGTNAETRAIPVVICTSSVLESADRARLVRARAVLSKAGLSRESVAAVVGPVIGMIPRLRVTGSP